MHDIDDMLPELMRRATDDLRPDTTGIVARGIRRGTTLRRRRTAGLALAAAGAIVVTGTVAVAAQRIGPGDPAGEAPVAGFTTHSPTVRPTPTPTAKPTATTLHPALRTLAALLPPGSVSAGRTWSAGPGHLGGRLTYDDGHGATEVSVMLDRAGPLLRQCKTETGGTCVERPDGSVLVYEREVPLTETHKDPQNGTRTQSPTGIVATWVYLHRKDGLLVGMSSYNALGEKDAAITRAKPPFTVEQLTAIAANKRWNAVAPKPAK